MSKCACLATAAVACWFVFGCSQGPETVPLGHEDPPQLLQLDREMPIIYDARYTVVPLHGEQYEAAVQYAQDRAPEGAKIWYLHVAENGYSGKWNESRYGWVWVYYVPPFQTERLRKGKVLTFHLDGAQVVEVLRPRLRDYGQVPPLGETFGARLEPPSKPLWPFGIHGDLSDEEIVEASDLARHLMHKTGPFAGKPVVIDGTVWDDANPLLDPSPIFSVRKQADGGIRIMTGTAQAPLTAHGELFEYVKEADRWLVRRYGSWES